MMIAMKRARRIMARLMGTVETEWDSRVCL